MLPMVPIMLSLVVSPVVPQTTVMSTTQTAVISMGFFDDLKKGFENDERLMAKDKADVNAGKNKNAPAYVKKKEQERKRMEAQRGESAKGDTSGSRLDELFSGWKW